jgi:hypothetical protein
MRSLFFFFFFFFFCSGVSRALESVHGSEPILSKQRHHDGRYGTNKLNKAGNARKTSFVYNENSDHWTRFEPREGIVTTEKNSFAKNQGQGRYRYNARYDRNGIHGVKLGNNADSTLRLSENEFKEGNVERPRKFADRARELQIERKPDLRGYHEQSALAAVVEKKRAFERIGHFSMSSSGATKPVGKGDSRAAGLIERDNKASLARREQSSSGSSNSNSNSASLSSSSTRVSSRLAATKEQERPDDRALLADHTFYAATNQQSNDRFQKILSRALNGTKFLKQCQKSESKTASLIPSVWQMMTATMSRQDAQSLLPISPSMLKKSIFGKVTTMMNNNNNNNGEASRKYRFNGYPKALEFHRGCAIVGNSGILLKNKHKKQLGPFIDAHGFVLRMNIAPTDGDFTKLVGKKTSVRLINHKWAREFDKFAMKHSNVLASDIAHSSSRRDANDAAYAVRTRDVAVAKNFAKIIGEKRARVFNARFVDISRIALAQVRACKEMRDTGKLKTHDTAPAPSAGFAAIMALSKVCPRLRLFGFDVNKDNKVPGVDYPYQYYEEIDDQGVVNVGSAAHDFDIEAEAIRGLERESASRVQICGSASTTECVL